MNKMKTLCYSVAIIFVLLSISACSQLFVDQDITAKELVFNIRVNYTTDTKAVKKEFALGDVVYAFFDNVVINETPKYAKLTFNGSNWEGSLEGGLSVSELAESGATMSAVYFPFGTVNISSSGEKYVFTGADNLPIYTYYLSAAAVDYTVQTEGTIATLNATLNMTIPDGFVQFFVDKSGNKYASDFTYRLIVHRICPVACASYSTNSTEGRFNEYTLDPGQPMWGYAYNDEGIAFSGTINNYTTFYNASQTWDVAGSHRLVFFELGEPALTKVFTDKTLESHQAIKLSNIATWERAVSEPSSADMGIYKNNDPSTGVKLYWAMTNLGATEAYYSLSSDTYGFYFAWGEIVPDGDDSKNWFLKNENDLKYWYWNINNKYNSVKNLLEPQDDAATAYLGDGWRMPTATEFQALISSTTNGCVKYNTDNRWKFTNGSTSIFLAPAGGKMPGNAPYGDHGRYWTANPQNVFFGCLINQIYLEDGNIGSSPSSIYYHYTIRPVKEVPVN